MPKGAMTLMGVWVLSLCAAGGSLTAETLLSEGKAAPEPIAAGYFPDRVHEFVWRNWNLVGPIRMAKLLETTEANILDLAASMGLPQPSPPPEMVRRGYITLLRRNWHILPYSQLLDLVEMTPEQFAVAWREDDFLSYKLGFCKPKCQPLHYVPPTDAVRRREAEIRSVLEKELGQSIKESGEARFAFIDRLAKPLADPAGAPMACPTYDQPVRIIHSYFALYGDSLANPKLDPYPDGLLQRLAALRINGVWLHVVLRDLAPGGNDFPEFGAGCEDRLANLRALVRRARRYGIGVYLYLNEPRTMPKQFFKDRPELAGVADGEYLALCTSQPKVRRWMSDALTYVFRATPDLAGVFAISASENLTNCASRYYSDQCPRCRHRSGSEIIAEVNATIEQGVHRGNAKAKVIAWDWGWRDNGEATEIIRRLPKSIQLMSVSEWDVPINRGGFKSNVGEYSLSVVGPGPRAARYWKQASEMGMRTAAKVQLNVTWELSTVPYLPVMDLVAKHCHNLALAGVDGMLLSWSLGGYPSPNLDIASRFCVKPAPNVAEVLDAVATERYGVEGGPLARKAWTIFSEAFQGYPYHHDSLYSCPVQMGPANPLYAKRTGYAATMTSIPYDDMAKWHSPYPADTFISQFEKMAMAWNSGLPFLKQATQKAPADRKEDVCAELRFAEVAYIHFRSVANQCRFVQARDRLVSAPSPQEKKRLRDEIRRVVESELALAQREFTLAQEDSRIGFEAANQYFFVPLDLAEKVVNCRWLLENWNRCFD